MARRLPASEHKTPLIAMVPMAVREQVERLADQEKVSVSEIGRRAITNYVRRRRVPVEAE